MEDKPRGTHDNREAAKERKSEATSKDTLSDLEQDETISDKEGGRQSAEPPTPDDPGIRQRTPDDTGPM